MLFEEPLQAIVKAAMAQDGVIHAHHLGALARAAEQARVTAPHIRIYRSGAPNKAVRQTNARGLHVNLVGRMLGLWQAALVQCDRHARAMICGTWD
jgi:hypothetical protein